jgi:hypothetical protein
MICVSVTSLFAEDVGKALKYRCEYGILPVRNTFHVGSAHI